MNFNKINNIVGWIIGLFACTVYVLTMEATGSLWDCGEFLSAAYKLGVSHPPGAPLQSMIQHLFMLPFKDNPAQGGNLFSALASGFTILFLFWTITHFAKRLVKKQHEELNSQEIFLIMAAGVVGALAYTFSDSFWYSAVEGEVYAISSFFTAVVFWGILKWEHTITEAGNDEVKLYHADKWFVFLFFMIGLSIGVHLLSLLIVPAVILIYYFKRFKVTKWGIFWAFLSSLAVLGFVQVVSIQWTIRGAALFDIFFNLNGFPIFTGFITYFILITALITWGIGFKKLKRNTFIIWVILLFTFFGLPFIYSPTDTLMTILKLFVVLGIAFAIGYFFKESAFRTLKLGLWCLAFILLGSQVPYFTTLIRSNADPALDMYNVDNPNTLKGYLGREQYGDFPIFFGQYFYERPYKFEKTGNRYVKLKDKYVRVGNESKPVYEKTHFFPRMWESNDEGRVSEYENSAGLKKDYDEKTGYFRGYIKGDELIPFDPQTRRFEKDVINFKDNLDFFFSYQVNQMYWRYFGWNFIGRENDLQGPNGPISSNVITGITPVDNILFSKKINELPDALKNNKARNTLFGLPLILGIIGFIFQLRKNKKDWLVTTILFLFTGLAIVVYLNQPPNQPRERDYAYVGSFYAFAIWIGLGVIMVKNWFEKLLKNSKSAGYVAALVTLFAVPILMASQTWDDHDRSRKNIALELAIDYLESCDKNAILFSYGDNDTYPLWYAQEVMNVRPDIRVINTSLLGIDWYINQLRYKVNESAPIDPIWSEEQIAGGRRDFIYYDEPQAKRLGIKPTDTVDLYAMMKNIAGSEDPSIQNINADDDDDGIPQYNFPAKNVKIPVDVDLVRKNGTVKEKDSVLSQIVFTLKDSYLDKGKTAILNIIAANKWNRPIYFTSNIDNIGFGNYLRQDGMTWRLVPIAEKDGTLNPNVDWMKKILLTKFGSGGAQLEGVYFDEENRRHLIDIRRTFAICAQELNDQNKTEEAKQIIRKADSLLNPSSVPIAINSRSNQHNIAALSLMREAYRAGERTIAEKYRMAIEKDLNQQLRYYASLGDMTEQELESNVSRYIQSQGREGYFTGGQELYFYEIRNNLYLKAELDRIKAEFVPAAKPPLKDSLNQKPLDSNNRDTSQKKIG